MPLRSSQSSFSTDPLVDAISTLKLAESLTQVQTDATKVLIREALQMKRALEFYANTDNYIDDAPMGTDPQDGLQTIPDNGKLAQWALHRIDLQLGPAWMAEEAEVVVAPAASDVVDAEVIAEAPAEDVVDSLDPNALELAGPNKPIINGGPH